MSAIFVNERYECYVCEDGALVWYKFAALLHVKLDVTHVIGLGAGVISCEVNRFIEEWIKTIVQYHHNITFLKEDLAICRWVKFKDKKCSKAA